MSHNRKKRVRRAVTLVELLLGLAILAVLATATTSLLTAAGNTNQYVNSATDSMSQVETAYRRILHNLRTASAITAPTNTTATTTFTVQTQPDPNYGNVAATVTYSVSSGNLVETDSRYGTNILVTNVGTFSVQRLSMSSPTQVSVSISVGTQRPVTRNVTVTCRNL
jgi:prepilin-type N-terminal cleavage/methylation domain-containing protein